LIGVDGYGVQRKKNAFFDEPLAKQKIRMLQCSIPFLESDFLIFL